MQPSRFSELWDALTPELRTRLAATPHRTLAPEEVDELARAGAREAHAVWFESRPGRVRQWLLTWDFRRFVEDVRDAERAARCGQPRRWGGRLGIPVQP